LASNARALFQKSFVAHQVYANYAEHLERCAAGGPNYLDGIPATSERVTTSTATTA